MTGGYCLCAKALRVTLQPEGISSPFCSPKCSLGVCRPISRGSGRAVSPAGALGLAPAPAERDTLALPSLSPNSVFPSAPHQTGAWAARSFPARWASSVQPQPATARGQEVTRSHPCWSQDWESILCFRTRTSHCHTLPKARCSAQWHQGSAPSNLGESFPICSQGSESLVVTGGAQTPLKGALGRSWAASSCHRSWQQEPLCPAEQCQRDGTGRTGDGTGQTMAHTGQTMACTGQTMACTGQMMARTGQSSFPTTAAGSAARGSWSSPAGCKALSARMAAKGPAAARGQEGRCCEPSGEAQPREPFHSHITSQPSAAARGSSSACPLPGPGRIPAQIR